MTKEPLRITLDTNLLHELWKDRPKAHLVEALINRARDGDIDLAVTARVREDIPRAPLASKLDALPELGISETGSVARLGYWQLGRDMLGSESFSMFYPTACDLARKRVGKVPDWRDWDHVHAHLLQRRDLFLTWDQGILCLQPELREQFGIHIMSPDDYLAG